MDRSPEEDTLDTSKRCESLIFCTSEPCWVYDTVRIFER